MGAPAAILISLIMVPELESERTGGTAVPEVAKVASSTMDAIVRGTAAGLELLLNICAMLIVLVALVHLANAIIGVLPPVAGAPITLQRVLGIVMAPVCWLMGIPWDQAVTAGGLMGIKTILNEFIAYVELSKLPADALDPRSRLILLYAMCGFANFGSLGIMIAGLATMAPERRDDVLALGGKSIVSGTHRHLPDGRDRRRAELVLLVWRESLMARLTMRLDLRIRASRPGRTDRRSHRGNTGAGPAGDTARCGRSSGRRAHGGLPVAVVPVLRTPQRLPGGARPVPPRLLDSLPSAAMGCPRAALLLVISAVRIRRSASGSRPA